MPSDIPAIQTHAERSQALSNRAGELLSKVDALPIHALRLELARIGWTSTLEVSSTGWGSARYGFGVRLRRWDWHGRRTCGDPHFMAFVKADELTHVSAEHAVRTVAKRALTGLRDFVDHLPRFEDGGLRVDAIHDSLFSTPMEYYHRPEWPTEDVPDDAIDYDDASFTALLTHMEVVGRRGWDIEHELTFMRFNVSDRSRDRRWGQAVDLTIHGKFGQHKSVMPHYIRIRIESLLASTGYRQVQGVIEEADSLSFSYGHRLPPGMQTVEQYRQAQGPARGE